ncbi:ParB/RepB/Spo0J family partition protein [Microbacterium dauci]|uniref:ParB N-terminal domain-containing protein n=1 Tax=Microbacterium dauci TaxID=3048008 RepID=A0ABT6ZAM5_9MICO|nr:ParB N-terminal domain-containing protein [Microbacterium sp. LX3-4]MDJ1113214.1 ParB N-terminal domain-containing protein [Microbacterium sp. LX3-4]
MPETTLEELTLLAVNPATLGVRDQVRGDATPDEALIASVRRHGIQQPPTVVWDATENRYVIAIGHRRVGAAIAAGLERIYVIVRDNAPIDEAGDLERQIVENERREGLNAKDLAAGYEKLSLFGLRPEDIAAGLGEKPERIRAGLKIKTSKTASELVDEQPSIDFAQAAAIADFDEHPKIQKRLVETATTRPENFARDVEAARDERAVVEKIAEIKAVLAAAGIPFIESFTYSQYGWTKKGGMYGGPGAEVSKLADPATPGVQLTPTDHADCPGRGAYIHRASPHYLTNDDGFEVGYVCTDWAEHGHIKWERAAAEKTPEELEREAERQRANEEWERAAAERQKAQAIFNANTRARRTWIHDHLTTGRLRPAAAHFDILAAAVGVQVYREEGQDADVTMELLAGDVRSPDTWSAHPNRDELVTIVTTRSAPSLRVALAAAFAVLEDIVEAGEGIAYFDALVALGYTLTDTDREHIERAKQALSADAELDGGADDE